MKADGNDYYYAHDHLYSPAALIDSSGTVLERYEYDAYGNCSILEPNFAPDPDGKSDYGNPYLFTGRRLDILDNSSLKIQYSRHRFYDTYTGRFLQHDPLGYVEGINLYEYVGNNPATLTDPYGLFPPKMIKKVFLYFPKMVMKAICEKDRSWEIHPKLRIGLFIVTYDLKCDCKFGYSWTDIPKEKCITRWTKGKFTSARDPTTVLEALKKLQVKYTATYGNDVADASVTGGAKGYYKSWYKAGIKYGLGYSVSAHGLKWIESCGCGCGKCARGFVSCNCKAKAKHNYLGSAEVAAGIVLVWYAAPALAGGAAGLAEKAWEAATQILPALGQ